MARQRAQACHGGQLEAQRSASESTLGVIPEITPQQLSGLVDVVGPDSPAAQAHRSSMGGKEIRI
jgi:hypothetical protein